MTDLQLYLLRALAPLAGAIVAGLGAEQSGAPGRIGSRSSGWRFLRRFLPDLPRRARWRRVSTGPVYTWLVSDGTRFEIGFLIDRLSALMMVVVTFVSADGPRLHHRLHGR